MRGHIDPETLAEFREGLLPRRRAQQVTAHLAECPDCAGLDAQLAAMPAVLASTPAPPMPAALTARIEAALAAEAAARAASTGAVVDGPAVGGAAAANGAAPGSAADTSTPSSAAPGAPAEDTASPGVPAPGSAAPRAAGSGTRAPQPRRPAPRAPAGRPGSRTRAPGRSRVLVGFAAAAAIVIIGGGGYGLSQLFANNGFSASSTSSGAGPASAPRSAAQGGGTAGHSVASGQEGTPANQALVPRMVHSGINYQPGELGHQVAAAMSKFRPAQPGPAQPTSPQPGSGKHMRASPATAIPELPSCVTSLVAGQRTLFVDEARYRGQLAVIFVVPGKGSTLRVVVAAAVCSGSTGHLLASTTLPR